MNKDLFATMLKAVKSCYAVEFSDRLPSISDFPTEIYENENSKPLSLEEFADNQINIYTKSVTLRIIAIDNLKKSRDSGLSLNLKKIWKLIYESVIILPVSATIASIGSQGFLSIPLFRMNDNLEDFEFIRLHIWDDSLSKYINESNSEKLAIHTHTFHTDSWVLCGQVINDRFNVIIKEIPEKHSLFTIHYNKTINEVNQHTSVATNTNLQVELSQLSHEIYMQGGTYSVNAGDYHSSGSNAGDNITSTLFSFTAKKGRVEQSYVVGPSKISSSEINRKMHIDPSELLEKINKNLKTHE